MQSADQIRDMAWSENPSLDADESPEDNARGNNVGAIAGGVAGSVGAFTVAALIWYFLRRRRTPLRPSTKA